MADNKTFQTTRFATLPTGTIVATDEIDGKDFQRMKLTIGEDGVDDGVVSSANPIPVTSTSTVLPTGAATSAKQLANGHSVAVASSALPTGASTSAKQLLVACLSSLQTLLLCHRSWRKAAC